MGRAGLRPWQTWERRKLAPAETGVGCRLTLRPEDHQALREAATGAGMSLRQYIKMIVVQSLDRESGTTTR